MPNDAAAPIYLHHESGVRIGPFDTAELAKEWVADNDARDRRSYRIMQGDVQLFPRAIWLR